MPARHAVIRLMLLVVFLNTTLGAWLHDSLHLAELGERLHVAATPVEAPSPEPDDEREIHRLCAWCLTQAHQAPGSAPPAAFDAPLSCGAALRLARSAASPPDAERWSFAVRDPPRILG